MATSASRLRSTRLRLAAAAAAVMVASAAAAVLIRPRRVLVEGLSMTPTLQPGDRLLVVRRPGPRHGAVVAVTDPRTPSRVLVKRVTSLVGDEVVVHGDNPAASTDSRDFGPVARRALLGTVAVRYRPRGRIGRLAPAPFDRGPGEVRSGG